MRIRIPQSGGGGGGLVPPIPLSDLAQDGAVLNDVVTWNGVAWVPDAPAAAGIGGTVGAVNNAVPVADGVGGSTLKATSVLIDPATGNVTGVGSLTCTAFVLDQTTYSGRTLNRARSDGANESVVLAPTGTGYISAHTPDGASTGGNQRGDNSVDWQSTRTVADRVASGTAATIVGGLNNQASGVYSVAGGEGARATNNWSVCFGRAGLASGSGSVAIGYQGTASGNGAGVYAADGTASGSNSMGLGWFGTASGTGSTVLGERALASLYGQVAHSSGLFAATGDNQSARLVCRRATSDATPSNLFPDGSSAPIVVPLNSSGIALLRLVARTNTAGGQTATGLRLVSWHCGASSATLTLSAVDTIGTDRGYSGGVWGAWPAGWGAAIAADTTNRAIDVKGTGAAATNIRWSLGIVWQEVTF